MMRRICIAVIFFYCFNVAGIPLNGLQYGEYESRRYEVSETVIVPAGKTMIIYPGAVLRFNRYTGLVVRGRLVCRADTSRGVLFTSSGGGEAYSVWNGIEVDSGGSVCLENCYVYNSVYGVKLSVSSGSVAIKSTLFRDNENDISVGDSMVVVKKDSPFTFYRNMTPEFKAMVGFDVMCEESVEVKGRWKIPFRISLGAFAVAGGVLCAVFHEKYDDYRERYAVAVEDAAEIREKGNSALYRRNAWGIICGAALCGFSATFLF